MNHQKIVLEEMTPEQIANIPLLFLLKTIESYLKLGKFTVEKFKFILSYMNVNKQDTEGNTLLHYIGKFDKTGKYIKEILNHNPDLSIVNKYNQTVLHTAIENVDYTHAARDIIHYLQDKPNFKEIINICDDLYGTNILHTSINAHLNVGINENFIELLVRLGLDINKPNKYKETPLHLAVRNSKDLIIKYLIKHGADKCLKNGYGDTPYDIASMIWTYSEDILNLLKCDKEA